MIHRSARSRNKLLSWPERLEIWPLLLELAALLKQQRFLILNSFSFSYPWSYINLTYFCQCRSLKWLIQFHKLMDSMLICKDMAFFKLLLMFTLRGFLIHLKTKWHWKGVCQALKKKKYTSSIHCQSLLILHSRSIDRRPSYPIKRVLMPHSIQTCCLSIIVQLFFFFEVNGSVQSVVPCSWDPRDSLCGWEDIGQGVTGSIIT